ncbi:hypothetical protein [Leptospira andrefontaineae]|uniref:Phage tail protein n=1 Tax=Leptospira andrefontaineae TaxID=2484976 RepID=A0A4R9GWY7_9LEPT|nr:hypothetical protein [Leptospira andrefontaineae]TGK36285.1 hypothetical protein EHO65_18465 [Leptospira andrefontaineae]
MKVQVDKMSAVSGWTGSDPTVIIQAVDYSECASSWIDGQLQVHLPANQKFYKDFSPEIDTKGADTLGFTVGTSLFTNPRCLKIKVFNGVSSKEFILTLQPKYSDYFVHLPFPKVTRVEFSTDTDLDLVITDLVAYKDEMSDDLNNAIAILFQRAVSGYNLPIVGTCLKASANSPNLRVSNLAFVEKFTVIEFNGEIHQVDAVSADPKNSDSILTFAQMFDGTKILNTIDNPVLKLAIPVKVNPRHVEASTPAISIEGGYDPSPIPEQSFPGDDIVCEDTEGNLYIRRKAGMYKHLPVIHGLFRSLGTKKMINSIFQQVQGLNRPIWINGRRVILKLSRSQEVSFDDDTGELQIPCEIDIGEYEWVTTITPKVVNPPEVTPKPTQPN